MPLVIYQNDATSSSKPSLTLDMQLQVRTPRSASQPRPQAQQAPTALSLSPTLTKIWQGIAPRPNSDSTVRFSTTALPAGACHALLTIGSCCQVLAKNVGSGSAGPFLGGFGTFRSQASYGGAHRARAHYASVQDELLDARTRRSFTSPHVECPAHPQERSLYSQALSPNAPHLHC